MLPAGFRSLNKAAVVVKRVPPDIEAGAPLGEMVDGSVDGTRPAIYYINLQDTAIWPKYTLPTLTFHETIPGHVWQFTFSHKLPLNFAPCWSSTHISKVTLSMPSSWPMSSASTRITRWGD